MAGAAAQGVMALMSFLWGRRADEGIVALGRGLATPTECRSFLDGLRVFDSEGYDEFGLADDHGSTERLSGVAERWLAEGTMGGLTVEAIDKTGGYLD